MHVARLVDTCGGVIWVGYGGDGRRGDRTWPGRLTTAADSSTHVRRWCMADASASRPWWHTGGTSMQQFVLPSLAASTSLAKECSWWWGLQGYGWWKERLALCSSCCLRQRRCGEQGEAASDGSQSSRARGAQGAYLYRHLQAPW
jgi:hypothetical protein